MLGCQMGAATGWEMLFDASWTNFYTESESVYYRYQACYLFHALFTPPFHFLHTKKKSPGGTEHPSIGVFEGFVGQTTTTTYYYYYY